ncbi:ATP-binding protein [uncultured Actinomyces sp.]|uniref:ATP-binding protein n=1 Tax=uncultured Actinomyces sp. TaxID=249061 RepID=UPI002611A997|nr:ATP-binding protein [uncultured Actinomyces sp.]
MSANRNVANLSVAVVKTLVRMTPFAAVADTIDSAQECLNLLADIKNNALDNPNAEMIRSLNSAVKSEIKSIEDALKQDGISRKLIKDAVAQLSEAARDTIKELAEDNNALIQAVQQPENFGAELKKHAARRSDGFSNIMQAHYTTLLDRITQEFLILAPWSPNFNRFALTSLLRCFPALSERIDRLEQQINEGFNSVREDAAAHHQDLKNDLASIHEDLRNKTTNSRPTKLEDEVWGSRPATLKHWIERDPTSNGTTIHDTIFSSPSSQRGSRCVLVGRAGSGKTSLAASIASRCESDTWSLVAWIDASTRSNIESGLIALGESVLYVQTNTQQDQRLRVEQVLATFRNTSKNKCLFVYDNVEGVDYLDGVLPDGPGVHVVVTTRRNSGWSNQEDWNIYALGNFTRDESVTHLLSVTKDTDQTTAGKVASYLGDLPLAIAQAAATCSNYYSNLQEYYADLQSTNIDELLEPIEGGYYNKGAIASLQLATKSVLSSIGDHKIQTEAETILAALCYLAESGVPTQWLKPDIHLTSRKAYKVLLDSSIIEQLNNGRTTSIHRLLAHAIRKRWDIGNYHEVANKVCSTISRQQDLISGEIGSKYSQTLTRNIIAQIYAMSYQKHSHFLFRSVPFLDCFYQTLTHLAHLQAHQRSLHSGEDIILANAIFLIADFSTSTSNAMTDDINEQYLRKEKVHKILQHFEGSIIWEVNISGWLDTQIPSAYFMLARAYQLSGFLEVAIDHYELLLDVCAHNFSPYSTFEVDVRNSLEAARRELAQRDDSSPTDERKEER